VLGWTFQVSDVHIAYPHQIPSQDDLQPCNCPERKEGVSMANAFLDELPPVPPEVSTGAHEIGAMS